MAETLELNVAAKKAAPVEGEFYTIGTLFHRHTPLGPSCYILARINKTECTLIALNGGNVWTFKTLLWKTHKADPLFPMIVFKDEFEEAFGKKFVKIQGAIYVLPSGSSTPGLA
jgi:hypothetical protein